MKKFLLMMLLLTVLASMLLAEDMQLQEITLDDFLSEYMPDYKIVKQIELNGGCLGYSVAKDTGEIVIATEDDMGCHIYFFDFQGNIIWKKNFESSNSNGKIIKYTPTEISDNGSVIVITKDVSGILVNMVYDHSGYLLFEKTNDNSIWYRLKPTPEGDFFYEIMGAMDSRIEGFYIYNKTGKSIELTGYNFNKEKWIRSVFINDNKVVIYMEDKISFFDFNEGNFALTTEFYLDKMHAFREAFQEDVLFNQKYIIVTDTKSITQSYLFDYNGNFIRNFPVYVNAAFINTNEILIRAVSFNSSSLKHINLDTNQIVHEFPIVKRVYYKEIIELNDILLISRTFWDAEENLVSSFIVDNESLVEVAGISELATCSDKNVLFLSLEDNYCSIIFGEVQK